MSSCSVYEALQGKMLVKCKVCFRCAPCHLPRISAPYLGPWKGLCSFRWGHPRILPVVPVCCRSTSCKNLMEDLWYGVTHLDRGVMVKRPSTPSCCYWVIEGVGYSEAVNSKKGLWVLWLRELHCEQEQVAWSRYKIGKIGLAVHTHQVKGPWTISESLSLLGH